MLTISRRSLVLKGGASAALLPMANLIQAQSPPPPTLNEPPKLAVGDSWSYRIAELQTNAQRNTFTQRVTEAGAAGYSIEGADASGRSFRFRLTPELNQPRSVDGNEHIEEFFSWPLQVGKKWPTRTWAQFNDGTVMRFDHERELTAIEKVSVPAGEFDAYKVVATGHWTITRNPRSYPNTYDRAEFVYWFSPQVGRIVKSENRQWLAGRPGLSWDRIEITEFRRAS